MSVTMNWGPMHAGFYQTDNTSNYVIVPNNYTLTYPAYVLTGTFPVDQETAEECDDKAAEHEREAQRYRDMAREKRLAQLVDETK